MDSDRLKSIPLFSTLSQKALDTVSVFATETSSPPASAWCTKATTPTT